VIKIPFIRPKGVFGFGFLKLPSESGLKKFLGSTGSSSGLD